MLVKLFNKMGWTLIPNKAFFEISNGEFDRGYEYGKFIGEYKGLARGEKKGYDKGYYRGCITGHDAGLAEAKEQHRKDLWAEYRMGRSIGIKEGHSLGTSEALHNIDKLYAMAHPEKKNAN